MNRQRYYFLAFRKTSISLCEEIKHTLMPLSYKDIEIMAPAGNFESLMAAAQGGANAVYFGVGNLNMRARAAHNFTTDDLPEIVKICKEYNMRSCLTVNIICYDDELDAVYQLIDAAKQHGISAVIASDMAIIQYARQKGVEVHISTQVNITNIEAVRFYAAFADTIVLARELNLSQVSYIARKISEEQIKGPSGKLVRLEIFCHGALCMAVSGKCYLSLHEYNASANRGACYQLCRRGYTATDNESGKQLVIDNEYIMSPKDLCTIGFLDKIIAAGARVLKIEGRARSAEYVKTTSSCYSQAVQAVFEHQYTPELIAALTEKLSRVFNRGFWDGYYQGARLGEWSEVYGNKSTQRKIYVAKATNYFGDIGVAEFLMETGEINVGDQLLIIGPTTGVLEIKAPEIRVALKPVSKAVKGDYFSMIVPIKIRRADKLYKIESV